MSKSKLELKNIANQWFTWFESNKFCNHLSYSYQINLVFEFCDYINTLPDWQIAAELGSENSEDIKNFKEMINNGIDYWLGGLIKSIYIH